jgi:hypothetical protein
MKRHNQRARQFLSLAQQQVQLLVSIEHMDDVRGRIPAVAEHAPFC